MKIILLRHAETKPDSSIPAREWELTDQGMNQAKALAVSCVFDSINFIYSSTEQKAIATATPISEKLELDVQKLDLFDELIRQGQYLPNDEYISRVKRMFDTLSESHDDWETAKSALERFKRGIDKVMMTNPNVDTGLVVSHGIILMLYFSHLSGLMEKGYVRWSRMQFCDWGIVQDGKIIKDII